MSATPTLRGQAARAVTHLLAAVLLVAMVALTASCSRRDQTRRTTSTSLRQLGAFRLGLENRPARPAVGDNKLIISVQDASGAPVAGARVEMMAVMAAMGAMPRMEGRGSVKEAGPGVYEAAYRLPMQGEWDVELAIRGPDRAEAVATYRLSTSTPQLTFVAGTPPPGASGTGAPTAAPNTSAPGVEGLGAVLLDPGRRQTIGVRTAVVAPRPIRISIRAAGKVAYDETRRAEVSLKFSGWVRDIRVDYTGRVVRQGEPLFTAYSPELLTAQQEYLEALRASKDVAAGSDATASDPDLAAAARQRLLLWDITPAQLNAIARSGRPLEAVPVMAPVSGVVVEKSVVRGSSFAAGQPLYKIAPIHPIWVIASVYQHELALVRPGMSAIVEAPFLPERSRAARVSYVNPYLDEGTRTGEVRLTVSNSQGDLKPGMFVEVVLERDLGTRLAVPESAVLYEGDRRVVFVDVGEGRLVPREVSLGAKAGDVFVVEGGLQAGEVVVTSGNFLIAAESKLRAAARR